MPSDADFERDLKSAIQCAGAHAKTKTPWAVGLSKPLQSAQKDWANAVAKAKMAEAAWKRRAGRKSDVFEQALAIWQTYANHLRGDLPIDELSQVLVPVETVGDLDDALDRMISAFAKGGTASTLHYAHWANAELIPARKALDLLLGATDTEYVAWREAAARRDAARASASELARRALRHARSAAAAEAAVPRATASSAGPRSSRTMAVAPPSGPRSTRKTTRAQA